MLKVLLVLILVDMSEGVVIGNGCVGERDFLGIFDNGMGFFLIGRKGFFVFWFSMNMKFIFIICVIILYVCLLCYILYRLG